MERHLPYSEIPCPLLKVGQCPNSDGCEYAHDFIAQPCLSAAQIEYRIGGLEDARLAADRKQREKIKRKKGQLRRLGARKLAAPSLIERGIRPTKDAIKHELGRYTVGPPKNNAPSAVRKRSSAEERRQHKILIRKKNIQIQIKGISRPSGANGNQPAKTDPVVSEGAPPSVGNTFFGDATAPGSMDVDEEVSEASRRVETVGDYTVKHPISTPLHLRHRCSNPSPAAANPPPPPKQPPYTDEGIIYAPSGEAAHEAEKEHVIKRERALSF